MPTDTDSDKQKSKGAHEDGPETSPPGPLPAITLPKGGGAIRGIGEKVSINAVTGTGSLTVPLPTSQGRSGFGPQLNLSYDSGAGNGPFGIGWTLGLPAITRKTDKGLPRYLDGEESDVFILSGAEDLVPVLGQDGRPSRVPRTVHGVDYEIAAYRPRVEGLFAQLERWRAVATGISHWRSITNDNVTTLYGFDPDSRIADPTDPHRIFSYLICRTFDDRGNVTVYTYLAEDGTGVDRSQAHEANRTEADRGTQRYLKSIRYAHSTPYFPTWTPGGAETPLPADWHVEVIISYGDHSPGLPMPQPDRAWPVRPDPFSVYRAGFQVRTYRRCESVLVFHHFPAELGVGKDCLVRSHDFSYSDEETPADPHNPIYTFLRSVTRTGYRRENGGYLHRSMPPLELEYSVPQIHDDVLTLDPDSRENLPEGLDGSRYRWVDLDGEGLAGILTDLGGGWGYKRNLSPLHQTTLPGGAHGTRARFGPLEAVAELPSRSNFGTEFQFMDLSGDGNPDLVTFAGSTPGFFERTPEAGWEPFQQFTSLPQLEWSEPNLKFVDLTGDGLADVLISEEGLLTFYPSLGEAGFGRAALVRTPWDEDRGPRIIFADGTQTIFLADMSGDGLSDIVRVRNGEVCYWPDLGYGRFGPRVAMDSCPRFADEEGFDPGRIRLADVDGSGTTDLLYIGEDGVLVCFNRSGNSWAEPSRLAVFPTADNLSAVQVMDLLGNGTACLVWSSPLPGEAAAALRYVDLMGGLKPHLLLSVRNNLGAETRLSYAPSTRFYLADKLTGSPWVTRLPFPVHVVERVEVYDWVARSRFITRYAYHHGYFDGDEREFRGFGMVEQWDTEEYRAETDFPAAANRDQASWIPPIRTRTWFHTGAFIEAGAVSRQYAHEYWVEPALRPEARSGDREAMLLPDTVLPPGLTPDEIREAYRALKGMALRTEVYADDDSAAAENPYSITEQNFTVRLLQTKGGNRHAVIFPHAREMVSFQYERRPEDPRVAHDVTLEVDEFGNVRRRVSVAYPRRAGHPDPEPTLSPAFRAMLAHDQARIHVAATENRFTNALTDPQVLPDTHRTPLPSETIVAELTGIAPAANRPGITNLFGFSELDGQWQAVWDGAHDVPYEEIPEGDIEGMGLPPNAPIRRIVERRRTRYRRDDLTDLLALDQLESQALPGETYHLALTPGLVTRLFGALVPDTTLAEGGYAHLAGSPDWWIPSGRLFYSPDQTASAPQELAEARAHFYSPRAAVDPFGAVTRVGYDAYDMLTTTGTDPVNNTTAAEHDYLVLLPHRVTDPNGNRVEVAFDALGFVVGTAVMGKTADVGDSLAGFDPDPPEATTLAHFADPLNDPAAILGSATSRTLYDLFAYQRSAANPQPDPPAVYALARETHVSDLAQSQATRYHHALAYTDGFAREIQRKIQAEPGPVTDGGPIVSPRWVGSAWTIYNNKGKSVRTFEPFFSGTHRFEFAQQVGVSTLLFYDPAERLVGTLHPDDTWEKVVFDTWRQETWDANDTVLVSDPRTDPDLGDHFRRILGDAPNAFTSWHDLRLAGTWGVDPGERAAQQDAAQKAAAHAATPTVVHFDARARTCIRIADNAGNGRVPSRIALDPESKQLAVFDALGRRVYEFCRREPQAGAGFRYLAGYDLAGNVLYRNGMDDGERRSLSNVMGNPLRSWDTRGHTFRVLHDLGQRATHRYVTTAGGPEILLERTLYGEGLPEHNLCGRLYRHYDTAGVASNEGYDFKGNLVKAVRQVARDYHRSPDWSALANLTDPAALEAAAAPLLVAEDRFVSITTYDALNRAIQVVTPHSPATRSNVVRTSYNEAGLLERVDVWFHQPNPPSSLLDPNTADLHSVTGVEYNPRGQSVEFALGNGTITTRTYDEQTFRPTHVSTVRPNSFAANQRLVQDLSFTYDPAGNVTRVRDTADTQNVIYFKNQRVEPSSDYTFDALYRLIRATGREHLGQSGGGLAPPQQVGNDDSTRVGIAHPSDGNAMGTYTETYVYDLVGNLTSLVHMVSSGSWTRRYAYEQQSAISATETSNRLSSTSLPGDPAGGPYTARYTYDSAGNVLSMPHLPELTWDELDRLRSTTRQVVNSGVPETTLSVYDTDSQRVRKVTDRQAQANQPSTRRSERLYLGAVEIYREFAGDGTTITLQRETLHIAAGRHRVALVETRTAGNDLAPAQLVRYQYTNPLGSVALELDAGADIISFEEYFPYGSSAYQAVRSQTETPKRYRFSGKERDEESDLYYHGARYYAPWLGRWTAADPKPAGEGGPNLYAYALDNPVKFVDLDGRDARASVDQKTHTITYSTTVHFFGTAAEIKQMRPILQDAQKFYNNPTIETGAQTQARFVASGPLPSSSGRSVFTDSSGTAWNVKFDVKYQLHDIAKTPPEATYASAMSTQQTATKFVHDLPTIEQKLNASVGFNPGDNVMTLQPKSSTAAGDTSLLSTPDAAFPTFSKPESRMLSAVTRGKTDIMRESVIHETGHLLGFDERYDGNTLTQNHNDFNWDFMSAAMSKSMDALTMHPQHIQDAGRFALAVANGRTLIDQTIRGIQIDDTGTKGNIQQFIGGAVNPAYTAQQALLARELIPHFRSVVTGAAPPAPAPKPQLVPTP